MSETFKNSARKNFTIVDNPFINCPELSWKAKAIYIYLLSKPDGWEPNRKDITNHATDGKAAVLAGMNELRECGLLTIAAKRDEAGQLCGRVWTLHPWDNYRRPENQSDGNRQTDFQSDGKLVGLKTGRTENWSNNKKEEQQDYNEQKEREHKSAHAPEPLASDGFSEHDLATPSQPSTRQPTPNERWILEVVHWPWVQELKRARLKIGPNNWQEWEGLLEDEFKGEVKALITFAKTLSGDRWPDRIEEEHRKRRPNASGSSNAEVIIL